MEGTKLVLGPNKKKYNKEKKDEISSKHMAA